MADKKNKKQIQHQRRTEDKLIIEVTRRNGAAPLDSSKWKCNWINCIGGCGLSGSGFCSEGGDWGKKNCITFKAIPLPEPLKLSPKDAQVLFLNCETDFIGKRYVKGVAPQPSQHSVKVKDEPLIKQINDVIYKIAPKLKIKQQVQMRIEIQQAITAYEQSRCAECKKGKSNE